MKNKKTILFTIFGIILVLFTIFCIREFIQDKEKDLSVDYTIVEKIDYENINMIIVKSNDNHYYKYTPEDTNVFNNLKEGKVINKIIPDGQMTEFYIVALIVSYCLYTGLYFGLLMVNIENKYHEK